MAIPMKDGLLVPYSTNFSVRINATPARYGLSPDQAGLYAAAHDAYVAAYNTMMQARADGTRSEAQTAAKNAAKRALLVYGRELYNFVQSNNSVSDADKILLGVHVRSGGYSPVPMPTVRPAMSLVSAVTRTVTVRIYDSASSSKRGKPEGAVTAWVYTFVGAEYPSDPTTWQFQGAFNKAEAKIDFPDTVPSGAQVWVCAAWVNRRGEAGPVSMPITANLPGGGSGSASSLKLAA